MPQAALTATAKATEVNGERVIRVELHNNGSTAALATKLTLEHAAVPSGTHSDVRILPAYYSDNYVSLMPGEATEVTIAAPENASRGAMKLGVRGWNITQTSVAVE